MPFICTAESCLYLSSFYLQFPLMNGYHLLLKEQCNIINPKTTFCEMINNGNKDESLIISPQKAGGRVKHKVTCYKNFFCRNAFWFRDKPFLGLVLFRSIYYPGIPKEGNMSFFFSFGRAGDSVLYSGPGCFNSKCDNAMLCSAKTSHTCSSFLSPTLARYLSSYLFSRMQVTRPSHPRSSRWSQRDDMMLLGVLNFHINVLPLREFAATSMTPFCVASVF